MITLQKIKLPLSIVLVLLALAFVGRAMPVSALSWDRVTSVVAQDAAETAPACGTPEERAANRNCLEADCKPDDGQPLNKENCHIVKWAVMATRALSALVGITVVIMVVVGGIQYSASRDNPQATAAAKGRIVNALLALVVYLFMFSFLQWAIPGGIF